MLTLKPGHTDVTRRTGKMFIPSVSRPSGWRLAGDETGASLSPSPHQSVSLPSPCIYP